MFCSSLRHSLISALPLLATLPPAAFAHDAKSGWAYPFACCSGFDCRAVEPKLISEKPEGFVIGTTGEVLSYSDRRIKNSPDGEFHWCSVAGKDNGRTICLFVPPRSF